MFRPRSMARLLSLSVLFAALAGPHATARAVNWSSVASDHFEVFISGNEKAAREAAFVLRPSFSAMNATNMRAWIASLCSQ